METMTNDKPNLLELFDNIKQSTLEINEVLELETTAIRNAELEAMEAITLEKTQKIAVLQTYQNKLYTLIGFNGAPGVSINDVLEAYIDQHNSAERTRLYARWNEVRDLLATCFKQNAVNGNVIHINLNQMQRIMRAIRQVDDNQLTYDNLGKLG